MRSRIGKGLLIAREARNGKRTGAPEMGHLPHLEDPFQIDA